MTRSTCSGSLVRADPACVRAPLPSFARCGPVRSSAVRSGPGPFSDRTKVLVATRTSGHAASTRYEGSSTPPDIVSTTERDVDRPAVTGRTTRLSPGFAASPMPDAAPPSGVATGALHVNGVPRSFPFRAGRRYGRLLRAALACSEQAILTGSTPKWSTHLLTASVSVGSDPRSVVEPALSQRSRTDPVRMVPDAGSEPALDQRSSPFPPDLGL